MADSNAQKIIDALGGAENIKSLGHCATRLRFVLKDSSTVNKDNVDSIDGVLGVVAGKDNKFQVIMGGAVEKYYSEIIQLPSMKQFDEKGNKDDKEESKPNKDLRTNEEVKKQSKMNKSKFVNYVFDYISDTFRPLLGVLLGASIVLALLNLAISLGIISSTSDNPTTMFLNSLGQGVFYFMPILVAYCATKTFRIDPWVGGIVMCILMTPHFMSLGDPQHYSSYWSTDENVTNALSSIFTTTNDTLGTAGTLTFTKVFGIPLLVYNYSGNVFVPLIMAPFIALIYKGFKRIIPSNIQMVFVPFFTILIGTCLTGFILGPIGVLAGDYLGYGLSWLNSNAPFIFMLVIPIIYPFLVPLGLHWPLNALMLVNISTMGYDFIQGPMGVWNFACFGTTLGVLLTCIKDKDARLKQVAYGALFAGLLGGISEPSLYGIHLRYKRAYPSLLTGCVVGAIVISCLCLIFPPATGAGVTTKIFAFTSLFTIPAFDNMFVYMISIATSFSVACISVCIRNFRTPQERERDLK